MTLRFKRAKSLFDLRCSEGMDILSDITHWPVCKKYLEKQVAKCVTECKSQASEARKQLTKRISECKDQASSYKKVVSSLAKNRKKRAQVAAGSAGEPDEFDSADDWSSDEFDTDNEDDNKDYANNINEDGISASDFASDSVSTNGPESVASSDSSGQYSEVALELRPTMPGRTGVWNVKGPPSGRELDTATPEPSVVLKSVSPLLTEGSPGTLKTRSPIPKPPSAAPHQLGKLGSGIVNGTTPSPTSTATTTPASGNSPNNVVHRRSVPKLQRPPSQPPAPPPPSKLRAEPETPASADEESWEYEIPNSGIPGQCLPILQQVQQGRVQVLPSAPVHLYHHNPQQQQVNGSPNWTQQRRIPDAVTDDGNNDTYEPVDKPEEEETYEAVDENRQQQMHWSQQEQNGGVSVGPTPCLPPRKPVSLPPYLLVPPLPEKPSKMISPPLPQIPPAPELPPVLPSSKGLSSSKSMSQLVNKFRSKLGGRRESNVSAKDIEAATQQEFVPQLNSAPSNGQVTVTVNGSTNVSGVVVVSTATNSLPPPLPQSYPPPRLSTPQSGSQSSDDNCSMILRPLPPVPSAQEKGEERLDLLPYYTDIERDEAEQRLLELHEEDTYLVRPSRRGGLDNPHTLTLIHKGRPFHLNIRLRPDGRYALGRKKDNEMVFPSISALVSHHQQHPIYLSAHGENVGTSLLRKHL